MRWNRTAVDGTVYWVGEAYRDGDLVEQDEVRQCKSNPWKLC